VDIIPKQAVVLTADVMSWLTKTTTIGHRHQLLLSGRMLK